MSASPDPPHSPYESRVESEGPAGPAEAPGTGPPHGHRAQEGGLARLHAKVRRQGLVRPQRGRLLAGVLAGLAQRLGVSPWVGRAIFLLSLFLPGPQFLAYAVLWVVMPTER